MILNRISFARGLLLAPAVSAGFGADFVDYEAFGAAGDGVHDDLPAICAAHEYANANGRPVRSRAGATYHLGRKALTAVIATDTDWGTSRFIIDDSQEVEDHKQSLFEVRSLLEPTDLQIERLKRDQRQLDVYPDSPHYVAVRGDEVLRYIRRGLNQNSGTPQQDCFVLHPDGSIEGAIDWDYETVSQVTAHPIDAKRLVVSGGVFTTIANRMRQPEGYNYWARNIVIKRSNTEVRGLTHLVTGEGEFGHPYSGFLSVRDCADVTLRDCFATAHKTYTTIGAAGKPVSMGSYDYTANSVVGFTMSGCRMENIHDRTRWGVIASNFCKNIVLENCTLNRMDAHMGVSGRYEIRGCTLGHMGLNAIGRGMLLLEGSTVHGGRSMINLRGDYGSSWEGEVVIRNSRWVPTEARTGVLELIHADNDGTHDFGYPCFMPRLVIIDDLEVDDSRQAVEDQGLFLFSDPGGAADAPYPYRLCETVEIRDLEIASGLEPLVSPNPRVAQKVVFVRN